MPSTPEELRGVTERLIAHLGAGGTPWREALWVVWKQPWGPTAQALPGRAAKAGLPALAQAFTALIEALRASAEGDERRAVAGEIRRLIDASGLTQRDFAALVGTSPSRLSTYVRGTVTPSAAMMLRIRRVAVREAGARKRGIPRPTSLGGRGHRGDRPS